MVITTSIYDAMIKLALIFNVCYLLLNYKKYKLKFLDVILILLLENIFIIIGGKLFTYLDEFPKYKIRDIPSLWFTSYGNMIGALIGLIIYSLIFKKKTIDLLALGSVPLPLVYAIGKIGCFTAGCCYGINYNGLGKVIYTSSLHAPLNTELFPVQLVEAITFTGTFKDFAYLLISISFSKFILDYLRAGRENIIFSFNQKISIVLFIWGLFILYRVYKKTKK